MLALVSLRAGRSDEAMTAIDAALRKFDAGRYEICDTCGGQIGAERLAARPAALTCVRCAAKRA